MNSLLKEIAKCTVCAPNLEHGCRPVLQASTQSKIAIVGQAPGRVVHQTGKPWDDRSGEVLRTWLDVDSSLFYSDVFALIPMGFCYPGTGKSGDLPPRPECAPLWHNKVFKGCKEITLTLLIGKYAQEHYLGKSAAKTLTENVRQFEKFLPDVLPLPHPSPRNNIWMKKNPWFKNDVLPYLKKRVKQALTVI